MIRARYIFASGISLVLMAGCSPSHERVVVHGLSGRYSFKYVSRSHLDLSNVLANNPDAPNGPGQDVTTEISGTWRVIPLRPDEANELVLIRLSDVDVAVTSGSQTAAGMGDLENQLDHDFFARMSPEGRVQGVQFGKSWSGNARDIAKTLISLAQFVGPKTGEGGDEWAADEDYFGGSYSTKYKVESRDSKVIKVLKDRVSASATTGTNGMMASHRDPTGVMRCEVDSPTGWVASMVGQLSHTIYVGDNQVGSETLTLELRRQGEAVLTATETADATTEQHQFSVDEPWHAISDFSIAPDQKLAMAKQALGSATEKSLRAEVQAFRGKNPAPASLPKVQVQLSALFTSDPAASETFVGVVAGLGPDDAAFQVVMNSLLRAGNRRAQASLVAIAQASSDHNVRGVIVSSLAPIEEPSPAMVTFVMSQTEIGDPKLADASWLSLGVLASAIAKQDPAGAQQLVKRIVAQWDKAPDPRRKAIYVLALGNSGDVEALPAIQTSLGSEDIGERRSAVQALAKFRGPSSVALLAKRIQSDASPVIRSVALGQLRWQSYDETVQALILSTLKKEKEPSVKVSALDYLKGRSLTPDLRSVVGDLAKSDSSAEVRTAAQALATG